MRYWQVFVLGGYYWSRAQDKEEDALFIVIRLFPLALGLECRAGHGNGLRKINILVLFLTGTNEYKICLRSSRGYI